MILSDLPNSNVLANPNALTMKQIGMVSYRTGWNSIQPNAPAGGITNNPNDASWTWSFIDSAVAQATTYNKSIILRILVQDTLTPAWAQANILQFKSIAGESLNIWWDTYFQSAVIAIIQAIATRYASAPISVIGVNIVSTDSGDWSVPHTTTGSNWVNTSSFNIPAVNSTVNVHTGGVNAGMRINQWCFVPGGGWFQATQASGSIQTVLQNLGTAGNASPGTTIPVNTTIQVNDVLTLQGPVYNYTTTQLVNAAKAIISAAHTAFPNAIVDQACGRSGTLDPFPGATTYQYNAATQIAQWAYANVPTGKFAVGKNTMHPQVGVPAFTLAQQDNSDLYLMAQTLAGSTNTSGTTGSIPANSLCLGQFSSTCYDVSGQYSASSTASALKSFGANGGFPYVNPIPVFQQTLTLCAQYKMAITEIYEPDAINILPVAGSFSANTPALGPQPSLSPLRTLTVYTV